MIPLLIASLLIPVLQPAYVPQRVYDTRQKSFADFEAMLADLARADVIFLGEQHDDPSTHALELAIVEGLTRRHVPLVIALEMFERDVQPVVDRYLEGEITEEQFLAGSRPWPRYATDYRPLIEFAKSHQVPVIASNVPRRIASDVSKTGMSVIDGLGADRVLAARDIHCPPSGPYYDRFLEAMNGGGHPPTAGDSTAADARAKADRFYFAQCVKDETMAESIADGWQRNYRRRAAVVHVNGSFHSDYTQGTAASTTNRMGGRRIAVVSFVPVDDIDREMPGAEDMKRADYLVYTVKPIIGSDPASPPRRMSSPR